MKLKPTGKSVMLFSGGLDSLLISHLRPADILLRVRMGGKYQEREDRCMKELAEKNMLPQFAKVVTLDLPLLAQFERTEDSIVPLRNLFLVALAALYGETVIIGAVKYDSKLLDKSHTFFHQASAMLSYLLGEQPWCEPHNIEVIAPYAEVSKSDLIERFIGQSWRDLGRSIHMLKTSFSCHEPTPAGNACGKCKPCLRKWLACEENGINTQGWFDTEPYESQMAQDIINGVYATSTMTKDQIIEAHFHSKK